MEENPPTTPLLVTAAVIARDGLVLVTQRPAGKDLSGLWEFPGGKMMPDESPEAGLVREIREELDLTIIVGSICAVAYHRYSPTKAILLLAYHCQALGDPCPMEGQRMQWVDRQQLRELDMPPADRPIIERVLANE